VTAGLLAFVCALLSPQALRIVEAAAGDLDPTFGSGGKVVTSFPGGLDIANDVAVQSDGKIILAGFSGSDFALARYHTNGTLDATFGAGGLVATDFPGENNNFAYALVIQADGRIVLAGTVNGESPDSSGFGLMRYNTDGSLDTTFDGDGRVATLFPNGGGSARAIALQPDGKLVVAGDSFESPIGHSVFTLARYNTDGSLDSSFDGDGLVKTDISANAVQFAFAVALQANGRIIAAGRNGDAFGLLRYNPDGSLDNGGTGDSTPGDSFGVAGIVTTTFGGNHSWVRALAIQADGKIVAAGGTDTSGASENNFALARYNTDGSLDTSFDGDGRITTDFGLDDAANDVKIQADGRIVAVGSTGSFAVSGSFALARYTANGSLDTSFDTDGKVLTDFSAGHFSSGALGVAMQNDGKIIAAGEASITGQRDFGVARYNANGSLDVSFDNDGKASTDFMLNEETVTRMVLQPDGKIVALGIYSSRRIVISNGPDFQLARYNVNGTLDTTFGSGGLVTTSFATDSDDLAFGIALQPDGKIVVAGQTGPYRSSVSIGDTDFAVVRYNIDGSLDTSFGMGGRVTADFGVSRAVAHAVAIQANGRLLVAGSNGDDFSDSNFALARFNTDGSLDSGMAGDLTPGDSFGTGGKLTTDFGGDHDSAYAVVIQTNGKIVASGTAGAFANEDFALARYNTDGSLDVSGFGLGGKVITDFNGASDEARDLKLQPDGKLVAAGWVTLSTFNRDFALARYNSDGSLDMAGFGSGGKVTTDFGGSEIAFGLALQGDGKLIAAGVSYPPDAPSFFALTRYTTNGTVDSSFGTAGKITTDFFGLDSGAGAIVIQSDGKVVAGGYAYTGSSDDFALARYQVDTPSVFQFSQANFNFTEDVSFASITVTRTGDTANSASVDYATADRVARQRTDYTLGAGTLVFNPGQTTRTVKVLITEDAYVEGGEPLNLFLTTPSAGGTLGTPSAATIVIIDDDSANPPTTNPIDDQNIFVREHYHDMLAREGDDGGIAYWTNEITKCGSDATCIRARRLAVSAAFFFEPEFQDTAAYLYRVYKVSFHNFPSYISFMRDRSRLVGGVMLEADKNAFNEAFVQRAAFLALFPLTMTPAQYVDALNANTSNALTQAQRDALVNGLAGNTETRGSVLRKVAENSVFIDQEYNNAFVVNLYFGYLRRDPEPGGFNFWLTQINSAPLRNVAKQQALVCSFITSQEYQERFSSVVTRTNAECGP
jgi:uncharacterized delta-60 repeat protein